MRCLPLVSESRMENISYLVRRARLLLNMTQEQFAGMCEVDTGAVSRWERGKVRPAQKIFDLVRGVNRESAVQAVKASPVMKYVAHMDDLTHRCVVSKGLHSVLQEAGVSHLELASIGEVPKSLTYPLIDTYRAIELIQRDPLWVERRAIYADSHCLSTFGYWISLLAAPLPDRPYALVEFAECVDGATGGFWVRVVGPDLK